MGSNIPKWRCILNYCYGFPEKNTQYLESQKNIDGFFPESIHNNKLHIFQNISKFSIHILRPLKYKNTSDLSDKIKDKRKGVK